MIDVSVVMPVGSIGPDVREQLAALAAQTHTDRWELVISLNASDARAQLDGELADFSASNVDIAVVDSSAVRSAAHARNAGAQAAKGQRLAFCDSDDIADPRWLASLMAGLDDHRAVGGFLEEQRLAVPGQENWRPPATPGGNPTFLGHEFLVSANMGIWADDFHAVGGFDETLIRGEDIAFSWALLSRGVTLGFVADAVMHYRHREGLWPMMHQHYLYGRGMSQLLARVGTPDGGGATLRPNGQPVARMSIVHVLRRGSIAAGRLVGLADEALRSRRGAQTTG